MAQSFIRKKNRLPIKQIYQSNNSFFITICVQGRTEIFDGVNNESVSGAISEMNHFRMGTIVEQVWLSLSEVFEGIVLDEYVIMPNHFHGIITFFDVPRSKLTQKDTDLSKIVKYFKAKSTLKIKECFVEEKLVSPKLQVNTANDGELKFAATKGLIKNYHSIWQKSFYDHIIRDEKDLQRIREYIFNNPLKWELDILNPKNDEQFRKCLFSKSSAKIN